MVAASAPKLAIWSAVNGGITALPHVGQAHKTVGPDVVAVASASQTTLPQNTQLPASR